MLRILSDKPIDRVKCNYVGFYKNYQTGIAIFTLPKIFLHNNRVFGKYDPQPFLHKPAKELLSPYEYETIKSLVERIYFCLRQYQREEAASIVDTEFGLSIRSNIGISEIGAFEAMLALIAFNKNNPHLYVQEQQILESKNPRRINWKKTFMSTVPVEIDGDFFYFDLKGGASKSKVDDPLLTIFYSLLNEFRQYDPTIHFDTSIKILPPTKLAKLKPKIALFLKTSRSLYFSDKFKQLHSLLQSYYLANKATYNNQRIEFLFTDDFEIVFERIVDSIISDEHLLYQYKYLKDGKEIDHLFGEKDVFHGNKIIYIGDSKYYKDSRKISIQRHKQFTYARNIIQENVYIINNGQETVYSRNYRDSTSEGYNITPNFFILGTVASSYIESSILIEPDIQAPEISYHFPNRLFDRDTLHILYFRADFLKLINFYISKYKKVAFSRQMAREQARRLIQQEFSQYLDSKYTFFRVRLSKDFIETNFKVVHGKIFTSPVVSPDYILALERTAINENAVILSLLNNLKIDMKEVDLANVSNI